jgi:hypothetical protein
MKSFKLIAAVWALRSVHLTVGGLLGMLLLCVLEFNRVELVVDAEVAISSAQWLHHMLILVL